MSIKSSQKANIIYCSNSPFWANTFRQGMYFATLGDCMIESADPSEAGGEAEGSEACASLRAGPRAPGARHENAVTVF
jgi:hypothetical protein